MRGKIRELVQDFVKKHHAVYSVIQGYNTTYHAVLVSSHPKKGKLVNVFSTMHSLEADIA